MSDNAPTPAPAAPKKNLLVPALLAVNTLAIAGALAVFLLRTPPAPKPAPEEAVAAAAEATPKPGTMVPLGDFVLQLRDGAVDHYAKLSFQVEVGGDRDAQALTARAPQIRDAFISTLSDRTTGDLQGSEGITRTKQLLQERLKGIVPAAEIRAVYLTELIVQ